jgi:hypothetical protein
MDGETVEKRDTQRMNALILLLLCAGWVLCIVAAVGIGHLIAETRWRKRRDMYTFDRMVREYREQSDLRMKV